MDNAQIEMPKYRSHKEVWALKIADVKKDSEVAAKEAPAAQTTGGSTANRPPSTITNRIGSYYAGT